MKFLAASLLLSAGILALPSPEPAPIVIPPACDPRTIPIGDGNPHQNYKEVQVTEGLSCGDGTCTASYITSHTVDWSFSLLGTGSGQPYEWITGGFSVGESHSTGQSSGCQGGPGQTVCVMKSVAHTAYTVRNTNSPNCGTNTASYIMKSPNSDGVGSHFWCKRSGCGSNGDTYWNMTYAPPGGPGPLGQEGSL